VKTYLVVEGRSARFAPLAAGAYIPTQKFLPHSAAYGLVLNLAGINARKIIPPPLRLAVGAVGAFPDVLVGCQHRHAWLVGNTAKLERPHGDKDAIKFTRVEYLANLNAAIAVEGELEVLSRVREQRGDTLFLGENDRFASQVRFLDVAPEAYWYRPVARDERIRDVRHSTYLTIRIDRVDSSKTVSKLFCPLTEATAEIPDEAWQDCFQAPGSVRFEKAEKRPKTKAGKKKGREPGGRGA
jgi:CRISPR-associated protein Cas5t